MSENLRFYLSCAVVGFLVSLWWRNETVEKFSFPWLALLVPIFWIATTTSLIAFVKEPSTSVGDAFLKSIDIRYFYRGREMVEMRAPGALAMFATATFALIIRWFWHLKNRGNI